MKRKKKVEKRQKKITPNTKTQKRNMGILMFLFSLSPFLDCSLEENYYVPRHDMGNNDERTLAEDLISPIIKREKTRGIR